MADVKTSKPIERENQSRLEVVKRHASLLTQKAPAKHPDNKVSLLKKKSPRHDKTLFCRYELKYRIPETKARAIAKYVQSYIGPDQYARKMPDQEYLISSLYLDSDNLHLCQETMNGKMSRFKLRIRCYDAKPETDCFFEIKRRINTVILKDRARVPKSQLTTVLRGGPLPVDLYEKDKRTLNQFNLYMENLRARPLVLVRYQRQAFEGDSSNRVRITFDRELCFKSVSTPLVTTNGPGWNAVSMDFVILEIKFTDRYPYWLSDLVKIFDLKQTAMSKYVSSVQQSCHMGFCAPTFTTGR